MFGCMLFKCTTMAYSMAYGDIFHATRTSIFHLSTGRQMKDNYKHGNYAYVRHEPLHRQGVTQRV